MTRLRESTKHAEQVAWPAVRDRLAELATPIAIDKLARTKQSRSNVRFVVESTIQTLAAAGLLRTPADAEVIAKALAWHESWGDAPDHHDEDVTDEDLRLYAAVEHLLDQTDGYPRT